MIDATISPPPLTTTARRTVVPRRPRGDFLPFAPPMLGEEEIAEVVETLRSPWLSTGPRTARFEREFAAFLGAPGALALNSCTAALHTALVCHGVGPGDEVITTPLTFAATANVIEHVGARPVFADVVRDTLTLDVEALERAITSRTRAIIPVHYAGHPVEMNDLLTLARRRGLVVIEDAAHAIPAAYRGRPVGGGTNPVAFSFYATKNLTTGEGGMLTGEPAFIEHARTVALHGMNRDAWRRYEKGGSWRYDVLLPGFKYNMSDIQAALGLWQLRRQPEFHRRRHEIAAAYNRAFAGEPALEEPAVRPWVDHAWHLYVLRLRPNLLSIDRDRFIEELTERQVGTSVHFIPVPLHPYYRDKYGYAPQDFPVAYDAYSRMLSLPIHPGLTDYDVADVVSAVLDVVARFRR